MKYRVIMSVLLICVLGALAASDLASLVSGPQQPASSPSLSSDDAAMKSLKIE